MIIEMYYMYIHVLLFLSSLSVCSAGSRYTLLFGRGVIQVQYTLYKLCSGTRIMTVIMLYCIRHIFHRLKISRIHLGHAFEGENIHEKVVNKTEKLKDPEKRRRIT